MLVRFALARLHGYNTIWQSSKYVIIECSFASYLSPVIMYESNYSHWLSSRYRITSLKSAMDSSRMHQVSMQFAGRFSDCEHEEGLSDSRNITWRHRVSSKWATEERTQQDAHGFVEPTFKWHCNCTAVHDSANFRMRSCVCTCLTECNSVKLHVGRRDKNRASISKKIEWFPKILCICAGEPSIVVH